MIPYGRQHIDSTDIDAVRTVLRSDWLTQGPKVAEFEAALAKYCGARYAVAVANGTVALHLAYLVAGLEPGDEVITTPNTFVATTNMLLAVGAKPVFADIRSDTWNIDEAKIEPLITKKTRAIVTVDFAGQPCDYKKIMALAKRHDLLLVEDACHALGASFNNRRVGSFADLTIFSFHPVKPITTAEGGAVLTNQKDLYERLKLLRSHGITKDKDGFNVMTELGYNYRLTDLQTALGISQLKKLDQFIAARRKVVSWYAKYLGGFNRVILPTESLGVSSAWHIYVIRTASPKDRLPLYNLLKKSGIGVNFHYPAVYSHPYYRTHGYAKISKPEMEKYQATAITLPLYPFLAEEKVKKIASLIRGYFKINHGGN